MSLKFRVIPCLDVDAGRVVKGVKFQNLRDAGDPAEISERYMREGADEIVFLDITASLQKRRAALRAVRKCAEKIFLPLTVGGGVRGLADFRRLLENGADKVAVNTAALQRPAVLTEAARTFGTQCVVAAVDAKRNGRGWRVYSHGGRRPTRWEVVRWAREVEKRGAGEILLTSIDRDGTREGYDLELLRAVCQAVRLPVIASGGAGAAKHFAEAFRAGATGGLAASLFHFGMLSIPALKKKLSQWKVPVRKN